MDTHSGQRARGQGSEASGIAERNMHPDGREVGEVSVRWCPGVGVTQQRNAEASTGLGSTDDTGGLDRKPDHSDEQVWEERDRGLGVEGSRRPAVNRSRCGERGWRGRWVPVRAFYF